MTDEGVTVYHVDWQTDAAGNLVITRQDATKDDTPRDLEEALEALFAKDSYEWLYPDEVGTLTDAPMLGYEVERDDDGDVMYVERVYWYPQNETRDPLAELLEGGRLVFQLAPSNDGSTYRHGMGPTPDERRLMQRIADAPSTLHPDDFNENARFVLEHLQDLRLIGLSPAPEGAHLQTYHVTDRGRDWLATEWEAEEE